MIFQDIHGLFLWKIKVILLSILKHLSKEFKTLKIWKLNIWSDHGGEFKNEVFETFCKKKGINHNFTFPRTPQQNGVVERKNRTLQECARTLLNGCSLPKHFWAEAVATACYVLNRISIRPLTKNTSYELFNNKKPNISYFKIFGSKCFILNTKDQLGKFDPKADEGIFFGYSDRSEAYKIFSKWNKTIEESLHVSFNENFLNHHDDEEIIPITNTINSINNETNAQNNTLMSSPRILKDHPKDNIIGDLNSRVIGNQLNQISHIALVSNFEPKNYKEASNDNFWIIAMQEELNQFERNNVWELVPRPENQSVIGTKWVFKNKADENGNILEIKHV